MNNRLIFSLITSVLFLGGCNKDKTVPISEQEAIKLITDCVNKELVNKTYVDIENTSYVFQEIRHEDWRIVELTAGRWIAIIAPPAGEYVTGSVDKNGQNCMLDKYGYASE